MGDSKVDSKGDMDVTSSGGATEAADEKDDKASVKKEDDEKDDKASVKKEDGEKEGEDKDGKAAEGVAAGLDENGIPVCFADLKYDTEDVDDIQESEHFENRLTFLNLCTGNHYQFDQLRRAKHSSMMVLYHLHNPDAPKFVPQCHVCRREILQGYRYNCPT